MAQKPKPASQAVLEELNHVNVSWEHQEKTVYTVEALDKEIREKLAPKDTSNDGDE